MVVAFCLVALRGFGQGKPSTVALCTPDQLSLGTDDEHGNFDGMSHSGTLLVLRNLGSDACRMPYTPQIALYGKSGVLKVKFTLTAVAGTFKAQSVIVAAGAELTSSLRWVSGDVYDPGMCVNATSLHVMVPSEDVSAKMKRLERAGAPYHVVVEGKALSTVIDKTLCGEKGKTIEAEMTRLATDPVYRPGKPGAPGS